MTGDFEKELKKAAHKYAMQTVKQPFTHKEAVKDVEETFIIGALASKRNDEAANHIRRPIKKLEELAKESLSKFYLKHYGTSELDPALIKTSEEDFYEGMNWELKYNWNNTPNSN